MNASAILDRLMREVQSAGGGTGATEATGSRSSGGLGGLVRGVASQLAGSSRDTRGGAGSSSGGLDVERLLGGSAVGLLLGSKRGRRLGGKALKLKVLAGAGMLAWKAWQNYQARQPTAGGTQAGAQASVPDSVEELQGEARERRSLEILQAMILAARADGHIDQQERNELTHQIEALGADPELHRWIEQQLEGPLDAQALARQADSPQAAREIYLVSVAMVDEQNAQERAWLDELAQALGIEPELARELERQVAEAA